MEEESTHMYLIPKKHFNAMLTENKTNFLFSKEKETKKQIFLSKNLLNSNISMERRWKKVKKDRVKMNLASPFSRKKNSSHF